MIEIGKEYNWLTVLERDFSVTDKNHSYWLCKCRCGKIKSIRGDKISSGATKSCGCYNSISRVNDIRNQVFNFLTVLEPTEKRRHSGDIIWKCKCKCGNYAYASGSELRNNRIQSCGCLHSKGEENIKTILSKNGILYQTQYKFKNLVDQDYLRFDFGIINEDNQLLYLIEFDGEIHYGKSGWNGIADAQIIKKHDQMKNDYCQKHQIPLIRIPYWKRNSITKEDLCLDTSKYIIDLS